jgi:hypothetical protein
LTPCVAQPDHGELAARAVMTLDEIPHQVASGVICDAKTLLALAILGLPVTAWVRHG